jgi:hypothetical protein
MKQQHIKSELSVEDLVNRLGRKELTLKNAGAFGEAAGIRDAIVIVYRMADEDETVPHPIEPSE